MNFCVVLAPPSVQGKGLAGHRRVQVEQRYASFTWYSRLVTPSLTRVHRYSAADLYITRFRLHCRRPVPYNWFIIFDAEFKPPLLQTATFPSYESRPTKVFLTCNEMEHDVTGNQDVEHCSFHRKPSGPLKHIFPAQRWRAHGVGIRT